MPGKPVAASFVKIARENRERKLDDLVRAGCVSSAVREDLKKLYATDEGLSLSLSEDASSNDGFDALVETLKKNRPLSLGERTGAQVLPSPHGKHELDSPIIQQAKRRAEERAKQPVG